MDSRKCSGKSNFSQTCSLLSQFMKENGSLGDLSLSLSPNLQPQVAETKNFLPMIEKSGQNMGEETIENVESERSQMTIFYKGQVLVFNDFPADKVTEILSMAGTANNGGSQNPKTFFTTSVAPKPAESSTNTVVGSNVVPSFVPFDAYMPRKASLARFFEKRKDRITARAPYHQMSKIKEDSSRPIESKTWLKLATRS